MFGKNDQTLIYLLVTEYDVIGRELFCSFGLITLHWPNSITIWSHLFDGKLIESAIIWINNRSDDLWW